LTFNAANDESPRWSPNNSRILFQNDRDHPFCQVADIYVMNADGSGQTRLTTDDNDDSAPSGRLTAARLLFKVSAMASIIKSM
jgi:TolB protein